MMKSTNDTNTPEPSSVERKRISRRQLGLLEDSSSQPDKLVTPRKRVRPKSKPKPDSGGLLEAPMGNATFLSDAQQSRGSSQNTEVSLSSTCEEPEPKRPRGRPKSKSAPSAQNLIHKRGSPASEPALTGGYVNVPIMCNIPHTHATEAQSAVFSVPAPAPKRARGRPKTKHKNLFTDQLQNVPTLRGNTSAGGEQLSLVVETINALEASNSERKHVTKSQNSLLVNSKLQVPGIKETNYDNLPAVVITKTNDTNAPELASIERNRISKRQSGLLEDSRPCNLVTPRKRGRPKSKPDSGSPIQTPKANTSSLHDGQQGRKSMRNTRLSLNSASEEPAPKKPRGRPKSKGSPCSQNLFHVGDLLTSVLGLARGDVNVPGLSNVERTQGTEGQSAVLLDSDAGPQPNKACGRPKTRRTLFLDALLQNVPPLADCTSAGAGPSKVPESSSSKRKREPKKPRTTLPNSKLQSTSKTAPSRKRGRPKSKKRKGFLAAAIVEPLPTAQQLFPVVESCKKCGARKILYESRTFCCGDGTVVLPSNTYPPQLIYLFTSRDEPALHFQKYARIYNNVFAYSSIGGDIDAQSLKGIYVFKLHGQLYHHVPDLLPSASGPRYLQLYFYDGQYEAERRAGCLPELRRDVVDILMQITSTNPYAQFFRSLKEFDIQENTQIVISKNTGRDQRVYNAPTSDEVAVIWTENSTDGETVGPHITVTGKTNRSHRIMHYYGCYDPLQYPLLFPYGECGWHQGLRKTENSKCTPPLTRPASSFSDADGLLEDETNRSLQRRVPGERQISCREYYCYKFQNRLGNILLRGGRCFQQYVVDMYVKLENTRLDFYRNNQGTIRAELYQGLLDTVQAGESSASNVGCRIVLPANHIGGPRDMKKRYLNSMSLVQRYGKPDLFVTITCNPNWPEIKRELGVGEQSHNRPDIVARVFRAKLISLKKKIIEEHVFGEVAAFIYVVEFQKRGLPHAHFLIILKTAYKIHDPSDFDKFVCAEIPSKQNGALRASVLNHNMHGPCGKLDPTCACMKHKKTKGHCKYGYPKQFTPETTNNSDGYPEYRRRDTGDDATVRKQTLDNRWVIPYNPYLMALFDCHLNVEVCSTIQAVKYLYKYVYKGHDKISFNVTQGDGPRVIDEIEQFQSGRWVSPCEAMWRIYGFDLYEIHPAVLPLQIHLANMQTIQIRESENLQDVISFEKRKRTPLMEFFNIYKSDIHGKVPKYLYGEFPEYYRWDTNERAWFKRKTKVIVIGRLVFVAPSEGERYFLRLLLMNVRGPKSFEDLRKVEGCECETFQEAALKLRLLEPDNTVEMCLDEAVAVQMPVALRRLFGTILIFCQPKDPVKLWEKYYEALSEDFRHSNPNENLKNKELTYRAIEQNVEAMGKSMKAFGLDHLSQQLDAEVHRTRDIVDALDAPIPDECIACINSLNMAQQQAFDTIIEHVKDGKPGAFFVDGPGGTGKTYLYNALYAEVRLMGKIVLPTATSGIAASNIPSGRTTHSRLKIPLDLDSCMSCNVPKQSSLAALLRETALIIWDEAAMARKEGIESVDLLLRDLCDPSQLFGGKIIVFGGDFRQILPVVPRKSNREVVHYSLVASKLWPQLTKFHLTENIRARQDPLFSSFLLALGNGDLQTEESEYVELPTGLVKYQDGDKTNSITATTELTFPRDDLGSYRPELFTTRAILTPMNEDVDAINSMLVGRFPGAATTYKSYDTVLDDKCNIYPTEFINKLSPGGMSPHELILKHNCPVILLRNLMPSAGLCNGTRLICKSFSPNLIGCEITTGHHAGEHVFIPRINLRPAATANYPFQFQRRQFPIKLSFAMTINKSQGQTLDQVSVYLPQQCFSPGQLYVALSRARSSDKVSVVATPAPEDAPQNSVKNIVSYAVLELAGITEKRQAQAQPSIAG